MYEAHYLQKILEVQRQTLRAVERTAELLETLMIDDELIEVETAQYAKLANQNRLTK